MDSDQGKLFLGGISWETDEEKLKDYFGSYGEVLQAVVMRDKLTGKPRGFGFVVFADPSVVDRVLENDRHVIDGRAVEAKRALSREEQVSKVGNSGGSRNYGGGGNTRTKKIFVGGLPPTLNEEGFRQYFETYGVVTDVVIMYDQQTNRPRGFGFVSFDSEEAVDNVLHKTFHDLNGKQVEVKRALPKDANPGSSGRLGGGASGGYQGYGNSSSYEGRMESNRYMTPQNTGGGYPSYGSSGYSTPGYGYGPNNGMGYGYGNYGGASYGGPASGGYANPNAPSAGYGAPPSAQRTSWSSQAPSAYGYGSSQWGNPNAGGGNAGQPPNTATAYGNQGYGYGGYGGAEGAYGAVGGRVGGGGPSGGTPSGDGGYMGRGYGDGWQSDPSQGSGNYGGSYGGGQTRQAPQQ